MSDTSYYFLPWVRYGLLKNDKGMPVLGENAFQGGLSLPERAKITVNLNLNDQPVKVNDLSLFGPGDVSGIDSREIVRTEPQHLTPDFLPNLFPFIEFDRPDFPWLFTPGKPDGNDCLLPWIVLVVLRKDNGKIITDPAKSSPELECDIKELPDLNESWAWAHAQYIGASAASQDHISNELANKPFQNVSRLICPRKLQANDHYMACVVPAFKVIESVDQDGVKSGQLAPAWKLSDSGIIRLPVYYHWEFSTAMEGDFESFIKRLKMPGELDIKVQESFFRSMDVSSLLANEPAQAVTLDIISALELETTINKSDLIPKDVEDVEDALKERIADSLSPSDNVPLPVYGSWHVKKDVPAIPSLDNAGLPPWYKKLNTDPRYRVAAALGTQVVQRQQERWMAEAWEQASGWQAANQLIRQKQLAENVSNSIFKRLGRLSDATFMQITEPIAKAVDYHLHSVEKKAAALQETKRTPTDLAENQLEKVLVSASCRRLLRSQGHLFSRGLGLDEQPLQQKKPKISRVSAAVGTNQKREETLVTSPVSVVIPWIIASYYPVFVLQAQPVLPEPPQELIEVKKNRLDNIRPDLTFREEMRARLELPESGLKDSRQRKLDKAPSAAEDQKPLELLSNDSLSFPQPMYEPLRDLFQEMLIPGLDQIPNNALAILKTNAAFIEAYLVGLNHEMSRELLWREFPTHLGKTYFRKFWDDRGSGKPAQDDISEIQDWVGGLGKNMAPDRGELWILLIKGDLLMRYPNTIIYAQKTGDTKYEFPVLRVSPVPGVTLLGFSIDQKANVANWSFILEEHPTETRFGLDIVRGENESLSTWRDLIWEDVPLRNDGSGYIYLKPDPVSDAAKKLATVDQTKATWARNSAHMAYIALQKPYRIIIPSGQWFV